MSAVATQNNMIAQTLLGEFDHELIATRKFLERIADDKLTWKPHEKSMSAGQLALHIAQIPGFIVSGAVGDAFEVPQRSEFPQPSSTKEILAALDVSEKQVHEQLPSISDARMQGSLPITKNGEELMSMPRAGFLRTVMLNHWYHHRGQLGVYLRLLGAKVPSAYGPSGDESPF